MGVSSGPLRRPRLTRSLSLSLSLNLSLISHFVKDSPSLAAFILDNNKKTLDSVPLFDRAISCSLIESRI
jgi:hypothetical protein